jgi:hypothetical protein
MKARKLGAIAAASLAALALCSCAIGPTVADDPDTVPTVIEIVQPAAGATILFDNQPLDFASGLCSYRSMGSGMERHTIEFLPSGSFEYYSVGEASAMDTCMQNPMTIDILKTTLRIQAAYTAIP